MKEFIKGFFMADQPQSSKRLMGIVSGFVLLIVCVLDIFHAITVSDTVLYVLTGYSAAALGFSTINIPGLKKKNEN